MLVDILDDPVEHKKHIQRYSNSVGCQMVYGFRTTSWSDPNLQSVLSIFSGVCDLSVSVPARLMDCYPMLQKLPNSLLPVCRKAIALNRQCTSVFLSRWLEAKLKIQKDLASPCFCTSLVQAQRLEGFSDELASYVAGDIVEAASSTTSDELFGFLMAMVTHPEVQAEAQREIDQEVGLDRLPRLEDMARLPYIRGCVRETIRWMPTTALLVPHSPLKDDIYGDFIIPAGSTVMLNVWALNMDPKRWPNPHKFDPTRFKNEVRSEYDIATSNDPASPRHNYIFGAGRRLCQGIHIAERSMFLAMACLLWSFDISSPDHSTIDTEDLRGGLAVSPAPFDCLFKPRDKNREKILRQEWISMQNEYLDPLTKQWANYPDNLPLSTYSADTMEGKK